MCEQQTAYPPTSKPTSPSKLQKNADEFKPGMFQENQRQKHNQPTIDKWFKVIMKEDKENEHKNKHNDAWIKYARPSRTKKQEKKQICASSRNPHEILYEDHEDEKDVDAKIITDKSTIVEIKAIVAERDDWHEKYDIEAMTVEIMQEQLKLLQKDYQNSTKESEKQTKRLRHENQQAHLRCSKLQQSIKTNKAEMEQLTKKNKELNKMNGKLTSSNKFRFHALQEEKENLKKRNAALEKENSSLYNKLTQKTIDLNNREKEWLMRFKDYEKLQIERDSLIKSKQVVEWLSREKNIPVEDIHRTLT